MLYWLLIVIFGVTVIPPAYAVSVAEISVALINVLAILNVVDTLFFSESVVKVPA